MRALLGAAVAAVVLSGCGDQGQGTLGGALLARAFPAAGAALGQEAPVAPADRPGFAPADIAANLDGFILVGIPTLGPAVPARLIGANGVTTTWDVQPGFSVAFRDGMLVATRGLGGDLMGADVSEVQAALSAGGGSATRAHDYLDSQDRIRTETYTCTITRQGREEVDLGLRQVVAAKFSESCESPSVIFENLYWLDSAGQILSSRQYVSLTVAYLRANQL